MSHKPFLLGATLTAGLLLSSCVNRTNVANSAASIYEAACAIEQGVDPALPLGAIKKQAAAIITAVGHTYQPAGVKE